MDNLRAGGDVNDRELTIQAMLDRFLEARCQRRGEGGIGGQFSSADLSWDDTTWTPSYAELDRCLAVLSLLARSRPFEFSALWWHLRHRYLQVEMARKEIFMQKTPHGQRRPQKLPENMEIIAGPTYIKGSTKAMVTVRVWDPKVTPSYVSAGISWLSGEFRGTPTIFATEVAA
jgi:hypothetical protein